MIGLQINPPVLLFAALLLLCAGYVVFRLIVRKEYRLLGRLRRRSSYLQLVVFAGLMCLPYLYNPPDWPWFWMLNGPTSLQQQIVGLVIILFGFVVAFGTMGWFGVQRAFGFQAEGLICTGPYRITRNPQILGGYLLVIGVTVQWPSWYSVIWIGLYGLIGHWMVMTEEEQLQRIFGETYEGYCRQTPRYIFRRMRS